LPPLNCGGQYTVKARVSHAEAEIGGFADSLRGQKIIAGLLGIFASLV
jgi:hypothetical protein